MIVQVLGVRLIALDGYCQARKCADRKYAATRQRDHSLFLLEDCPLSFNE